MRSQSLDERALLLLGLLSRQDLHGYQLNHFIEHGLGCPVHLPRPTAYALLDKMEQMGLIESHQEQEQNRPPRKVYHLTDSGREQFLTLLTDHLTQIRPEAFSEVALLFLEDLPSTQQQQVLKNRSEALGLQLSHLSRHAQGNLALERSRVLLEAEKNWLDSQIHTFKEEQ